jgi:hypothetical protein
MKEIKLDERIGLTPKGWKLVMNDRERVELKSYCLKGAESCIECPLAGGVVRPCVFLVVPAE